MPKIYLAGGLFNAGERLHNLLLEKYLIALGWEIVLPQREAVKFFDGNVFDVAGIVTDCRDSSSSKNNILVGSADGADADSGMSVEYGMAITATHRAIVYRTDFRTDPEKEIGFNAMLNTPGTTFIYAPCFFSELDQVDAYYAKLAQKIHNALIEFE